MTNDEAMGVLAILQAAYPQSYRNVTVDDANGIAVMWGIQFADIPANIVLLAINKWISSNPFPPAISELKKKIADMYWESWQLLENNKRRKNLTPEQVREYEQIYEVAEAIRSHRNYEPTLSELTSGNSRLYLPEK